MGAEGYTLGEAEDGVEGDLRLIMGSIRPVGGGGYRDDGFFMEGRRSTRRRSYKVLPNRPSLQIFQGRAS